MADRQFVVLRLENERYGIDIQHVSSISEYIEITKVPTAEPLISGVINLRGEIIPVVNLKQKFGFCEQPCDTNTRIIICKSCNNVVGFLVDEASQVILLKDEDIESPPAIIGGADREYIAGIGKLQDKIIILLDLERMTDEFAGAVGHTEIRAEDACSH